MPAETLAPVDRVARPTFVGAGERPLFLWHHQPPPHRRRAAAIVLCPAIGYEYMSAYRSWRVLAERLASRGFDTIRFDYDGTGNSAGGPEDPGRLDAWLRSIQRAVAETRRLTQVDRIALVGLRAGSMLALQAAATLDNIDRLVLWSPFASGRTYVRELRAMARLNELGEDGDGPGLNAEGHVMTDETIGSLMGWMSEKVANRPATKVLLLEREDRRAELNLEAHLRALGSSVDRQAVTGTAEMLLPPHLAKVPEQALDAIVSWFDPWQRLSSAPGRPLEVDAPASREACGHGYDERPVRFGPHDRLFGILTRPAHASTAASIILLSTGAGHHVGPHRLYVPLAREWAAEGHLVLRFDLGGIGDSVPPRGAVSGDAYPSHMLDDAREAIAFVRKQAPDKPIVLVGLCSGGWLAFEAARSGLDVNAIASINPPLYLRDGGRQWVQQQREFDRYQRSIRDPFKWLKAVRRGGTAARALRAIVRRAGSRAAARLTRVVGRPLPTGLSRDLVAIAGHKIATFFVFSNGDNGYRYFEQHSMPARGRSNVRRLVQHVVVDDAGHAFRPLAAQRTLKSLLTQFVSRVGAPTESRSPQNATWTRRPV